MKFYNLFALAAVTVLSFSFTSCDDDNDKEEGKYNPSVLLLPTNITETYNDKTNDRSEYAFMYDATDTTRITSYSMTEYYGNNNSYKTTTNIEYNSNGQIVAMEEVNQSGRTYKHTFSYAQQKANTTSNVLISKKNEDGFIVAAYTVNSNGYLVSSQDDLEYDDNDIYFYQYSGNNTSKATQKTKKEGSDELIVLLEASINYNKNNGVFRNVTTPQWFLVTELEDLAQGQIQNNISKVNSKIYDYDKASTPVIVNHTTNVNYKSFIQNFPNKYEHVYSYSNEEDNETEIYEVKYNFTK